jgi:hypothetical protein
MKRFILSCLLLGLVGLSACQPQPVAAIVTGSRSVTAVIETVDPQTREVLLTGQAGNRLVMRLGPQVQNFAQLRPGQRVMVTYNQALAAAIAPAGPGAPPTAVMTGSAAAPGQLPGGSVGGAVQVRVTITAIDLANNTVSFVGPRNIPREVAVNNPAMQALLRSLHPGSQVDVTYAEALAVSVQPMAN